MYLWDSVVFWLFLLALWKCTEVLERGQDGTSFYEDRDEDWKENETDTLRSWRNSLTSGQSVHMWSGRTRPTLQKVNAAPANVHQFIQFKLKEAGVCVCDKICIEARGM